MWLTILLLTSAILQYGTSKIIVAKENSVQFHICIRRILERFTKEKLVIIKYENNLENSELFRNLDRTVVIFQLETEDANFIYSKHEQIYLVEFEDLDDLQYKLNIKKHNRIWETETKFIFALKNSYRYFQSHVTEIIKILAEIDIFNFVILISSELETDKIEIFSWFPFQNGSCLNNYHSYETMGFCKNGEAVVDKKPFADKFPDKFPGCKVKVRLVTWPPFAGQDKGSDTNETKFIGIDVSLTRLLSETLGVEAFYAVGPKPYDWGRFEENGTATGSLVGLMNGTSDINAGGFAATLPRMKYLEISRPHVIDSAMWCVPHAAHVPEWRLTLDALDYKHKFPVVCCVLFVFSFLIWRLCLLSPNERDIYKKPIRCLLCMYAFTVGIGVRLLPKTLKIRLMFMGYLLYCLNTITLYESQLMSALMNPFFEPQIETLKDILNANLRIRYIKNFERYVVSYKKGDLISQVLSRWETCSSFTGCLGDVAYGRNSAMAAPRLPLEYSFNNYIDEKQIPRIYCFKENIVSYGISLLMRKKFYLKDKIDYTISRILAAGFMDYWLKNMRSRARESLFKSLASVEKKINMKHLQSVFIMFSLGIAFSCIVFVYEILYNQKQKKLLRKSKL